MKNFKYGSDEHNDWLATNRTHEECADCKFEYAQFPPCVKGHAAGPTACQHYEKQVTHNAELMGRAL